MRGVARVVCDVSLQIGEGEILGLVGESGSGKSVTCRALLGLVPPPGAVLAGEVMLGERDLLRLSPAELREVRGAELAMVFQDAMSSMNPVLTVGRQLIETLVHRQGMSKVAARERAVGLLEQVGISAPEEAVEGVLARALRRDAAAGDDRACARRRPAPAPRRRAYDGARRHDPGPDSLPAPRDPRRDRAWRSSSSPTTWA